MIKEDRKPIKVSGGEFVTDSNFEPILFTYKQAVDYAKKYKDRLKKEIKYNLKLKGVRDCGAYWTYTIG